MIWELLKTIRDDYRATVPIFGVLMYREAAWMVWPLLMIGSGMIGLLGLLGVLDRLGLWHFLYAVIVCPFAFLALVVFAIAWKICTDNRFRAIEQKRKTASQSTANPTPNLGGVHLTESHDEFVDLVNRSVTNPNLNGVVLITTADRDDDETKVMEMFPVDLSPSELLTLLRVATAMVDTAVKARGEGTDGPELNPRGKNVYH